MAAECLPIYQPKVMFADIYFRHPGAKPALKYNHDVDIVMLTPIYAAAQWPMGTSPSSDMRLKLDSIRVE